MCVCAYMFMFDNESKHVKFGMGRYRK